MKILVETKESDFDQKPAGNFDVHPSYKRSCQDHKQTLVAEKILNIKNYINKRISWITFSFSYKPSNYSPIKTPKFIISTKIWIYNDTQISSPICNPHNPMQPLLCYHSSFCNGKKSTERKNTFPGNLVPSRNISSLEYQGSQDVIFPLLVTYNIIPACFSK